MKPSSIIALIVAVLLVIVGLTTCIIAQNMANANGETLFSEVKSDGLVNTVSLADLDISKIELIVNDADINIYGKSSAPYIEFVNFRENYYTMTTANKVLSFDEIPDVISMLKFWENGFSFKGMRYIFNFKPETEGRKVINVYLNADVGIKIFNVTANNCTLNMENLTYGSDYNLNIDTGEINVKTLKTSSALNINGNDIKLNVSTAIVNTSEITANKLDFSAVSFRSNGSSVIECKTGNIDITSPKSLDLINFDINTSGKIEIGGNTMKKTYTSTVPDSGSSIKITSDSADISIKQSGSPNPESDIAE